MAIRLKSRTQAPPGGFIVTIPKLNRTKQFWAFSDAVAWFKSIALANPSAQITTNDREIADFIDQQNALRVTAISGADIYLMQKGGQTALAGAKKATLFRPVLAVGEKIKQLVAGAKVLQDWLEDGGCIPVERNLAEKRAAICIACPQNSHGDLTSIFTVPASAQIKALLNRAKSEKMETSVDDKLGVCAACLCPLKLKVHVPIDHIREHLTEDAKNHLDKNCWIVHNIK